MLHSPRRIAQLVALGFVMLAYLAVVFIPTYGGSTTYSDRTVSTHSETALEVNGSGILVTLAIPLLFTAAPALTRGAAWLPVSLTCMVLLIAFTVLSILTLGRFFIPAALASIVAVLLPARSRRTATV